MTRDEAIAQAKAATASLQEVMQWFETNEPSRRKTRLHRHSAILASEWEEELGLPYGSLKGDDGEPKPPPAP